MSVKNGFERAENFTEEDYMKFKKILFSSSTPVEELERICVLLANSPTKQAQQILARFKQSDRAQEVQFLDVTVDEGTSNYLTPQDAHEEKDYLALQVIYEMDRELKELNQELEDALMDAARIAIKHEAVAELVNRGELEKEEERDLSEEASTFHARIDDIKLEIQKKEKIVIEIRNMIQTEKYRDVENDVLKNLFSH